MTKMMHGETALDKAMQASEALFGGEINGLSAADIKEIFADVPSGVIAADSMNGEGLPIVNLLSDCGFMKSKGEVKRAIAEGGVYINNHRVTDVNASIRKDQFIEGKYLVLRRGKKNYFLLKTEQE